MAHPVGLAQALVHAAVVHQCRREVLAAHAQAAAGRPWRRHRGLCSGWPGVRSCTAGSWPWGQGEAGLAEIRQGLATELATGSTLYQPYFLGLLAEAYGAGGHPDEGLAALAEALAVMDTTELRYYGAELYRLKGALLLQQRCRMRRRRQPVSTRPSTSPVNSRPNPSNSVPLPAWPACGSPRTSARRPPICWRRCTSGSPRGLTPLISRKPKHCWRR